MIQTINDAAWPETGDADLLQYVKDAIQMQLLRLVTRDIIAKCTTKMSQMKRQKYADDDAQMDGFDAWYLQTKYIDRFCFFDDVYMIVMYLYNIRMIFYHTVTE